MADLTGIWGKVKALRALEGAAETDRETVEEYALWRAGRAAQAEIAREATAFLKAHGFTAGGTKPSPAPRFANHPRRRTS